MKNIIKLLPDSIANQIAAGEVVQRPSSVIKELIENALDAGATKIKVYIKEAGRTLISVADNGSGMSELDAQMCFEKHATSKLRNAEDLFSLYTMGFRGEALPSIASVSKIEMETHDGIGDVGTKISLEANKVMHKEPQVCAKGTKINVKNLFFNIPARRNFLKSDGAETKALIDEFTRQAIAHNQIEFEFIQDDKTIYSLFSTNLSQRIVSLLGENYRENLIPIDAEVKGVKIHGFVGKPAFAKKNRGDQFIFVNRRFIKSPIIVGAVKSAYQNIIQQGLIPFFAIFIDIDPRMVDVNVHPNKIEVKFDNDNIVFSLIVSTIKKSLSSYNIAPALDFDLNTNFINNLSSSIYKTPSSQNNSVYSEKYSFRPSKISSNSDYSLDLQKKWESFAAQEVEKNDQLIVSSLENKLTCEKKTVTLLFKKYILLQTTSYTLIIDKVAAYFRVLYEELLSKKKDAILSQNLIFPIIFTVSKNFVPLFSENIDLLYSAGFFLDFDCEGKVTVKSIPTDILESEVENCIIDILETLGHTILSGLDSKEKFIISSSKNIASRSNKASSHEEMIFLIEKLFSSSSPAVTPTGEKIFVSLSRNDVENMFC